MAVKAVKSTSIERTDANLPSTSASATSATQIGAPSVVNTAIQSPVGVVSPISQPKLTKAVSKDSVQSGGGGHQSDSNASQTSSMHFVLFFTSAIKPVSMN